MSGIWRPDGLWCQLTGHDAAKQVLPSIGLLPAWSQHLTLDPSLTLGDIYRCMARDDSNILDLMIDYSCNVLSFPFRDDILDIEVYKIISLVAGALTIETKARLVLAESGIGGTRVFLNTNVLWPTGVAATVHFTVGEFLTALFVLLCLPNDDAQLV